eukprot:COSAG02_NODE_11237_length_1764_cov_1.651652_2_plen_87_part_00
MARAAAVGLALLLVSPPGDGSHGPVARVAIFNPVLGEVLTAAAAKPDAATSPDGTLALAVHFAVVGPPKATKTCSRSDSSCIASAR